MQCTQLNQHTLIIEGAEHNRMEGLLREGSD